MTAMCNFIEDYLNDPARAISTARGLASSILSNEEYDDDQIYDEIASPEFRLYEEMILCDMEENTPHVSGFAVVA